MNRWFTVALICGLPSWVHAEERPLVGYLVEQYLGPLGSPVSILSGWDLTTNGGYFASGWGGLQIIDNSNTAGVSMRRRFVRQTSGAIVLEYRFNASAKVDGLTWQLRNGTQTVVNVLTSGGNLCYENVAGMAIPLQAYSANTEVGVRVVADVSANKADLYVNGSLKASGVSFRNPADGIDQFFLDTGATGTLTLNQRGVHIYKGYLVNERFLAQDQGAVPDGWTTGVGGGTVSVVKDPAAASYADGNSVVLNDTNSANSVSVAKMFAPQTGKLEFEFKFMQPAKHDGFTADVGQGSVPATRLITDHGNLCYLDADGSLVSVWNNYLSNLWYFVRVTVDLNTRTGDVTINDIPRATGVRLVAPSVSQVDTIRFTTSVSNPDVVWLDDIQVYPFQDYPSDYVPAPVPVPHDPYRIGVQVCNLWREGTQYGWDWISSDPDRSPLLGFYDEGNPEVADWEIKFLVDHGVDFIAPCWYRPSTSAGQGPIKDGNYHITGLNAYKRAKYSTNLHYSLIMETANAPMKSLDDWKTNVVPFLIEHYFKDPRFLVIDNKPVLAFFGGIANTGDEAAARDYLRDRCVDAGFAGVTLLGVFDYSYTYSKQFTAESVTNHISSPSVNWDRSAWDLPFQDAGVWRSAANYQSLLTAQKACLPSKMGLAQTMFLLDNWNEYGEGHFLMPTEGFGFRYLDAIRAVFGDGSAHTDVIPTPQQKARINILYPQPRITADPSDQTAIIGQTATFSVGTAGARPCFYQWRRNGCDLPGATNASCAFSPVLPENQGSLFNVAVSNAMGQFVSDAAVLNMVAYSRMCRMKVSIAGYDRSETLTNFPVLVKFSPGLTNGFAYSQFCSPLGYDLRFKDETGTQDLNFEIETWNTNGESLVWVQVPQLTNHACFWATWGDFALVNSPAACSTSGAAWDSTYRAVWHMKEGSGTALHDSTANANHGVLYQGAAWTPGRAGNALLLDGTTPSYVNAGTNASLSLTNRFTLSAWILPATYHTNGYFGLRNGFLSRGPTSASTLNYALETKDSTTVTFVKRTSAEGLIFYDFPIPALTADWTLVTMNVLDGNVSLSINGTFCGSKTVVGGIAFMPGTDTLYLGCIMPSRAETSFAGGLDEVRICSAIESSNRVWAGWMNLASNSVLVSFGNVSNGIADADANGNGLPDLWELLYFGSTNAPNGGPQDDWDGDGMSNLAEYVAGTCPTNAASVLRIDAVMLAGTPGQFTLRWPSVAGRSYSIRTSTNLQVGFDGLEASHLPATPAFNTHTVKVDQVRSRYYRVTVEQ